MNYEQITDRHHADCTTHEAALAEWCSNSKILSQLARLEALALSSDDDCELERIDTWTRQVEARQAELEKILK